MVGLCFANRKTFGITHQVFEAIQIVQFGSQILKFISFFYDLDEFFYQILLLFFQNLFAFKTDQVIHYFEFFLETKDRNYLRSELDHYKSDQCFDKVKVIRIDGNHEYIDELFYAEFL